MFIGSSCTDKFPFFSSINAMLENARFTILECCINISGADVL